MQVVFHDCALAKESTWQTVVLIFKRAIRDFRGIGMVEVLWNTVTSLLNRQLTTAINLHDVMHRFLVRQRKGTVSLEAKLIQHLMAMREAVLFEIFL